MVPARLCTSLLHPRAKPSASVGWLALIGFLWGVDSRMPLKHWRCSTTAAARRFMQQEISTLGQYIGSRGGMEQAGYRWATALIGTFMPWLSSTTVAAQISISAVSS